MSSLMENFKEFQEFNRGNEVYWIPTHDLQSDSNIRKEIIISLCKKHCLSCSCSFVGYSEELMIHHLQNMRKTKNRTHKPFRSLFKNELLLEGIFSADLESPNSNCDFVIFSNENQLLYERS